MRTKKRTAKAADQAICKSFDMPDEVREFPKGRLEMVTVNGSVIGRAILEPGWRWSASVQPIVKTRSCEAGHFQYHVAGILRVRMDDGAEIECRPGDVSMLPTGHDAWVVGDAPVVIVDFQGMATYAQALSSNGRRRAGAAHRGRAARGRAGSARRRAA